VCVYLEGEQRHCTTLISVVGRDSALSRISIFVVALRLADEMKGLKLPSAK
jgi:hypothetical protein